MKKFFLTVTVAICAATFALAQSGSTGSSLETANGTPILPAEGSIALGVDATPFLRYIGGIFSDNDASTPAFTYGSFYGKYFLSDRTALRGKVRLGYDANSDRTVVPKIGGAADETVENVTTTSNMNVALNVGLEKRLGETRLQGFYGVDVGFLLGSTGNVSRTYGNELSSTNTASRLLSSNNGLTFGLGANLFAGVEYFVAPGVAIGGELGWGIGFTYTGNGKDKYESWDNGSVKTDEQESGGASRFRFDNFDGALTLTFYF
jgi:hypothetical protein